MAYTVRDYCFQMYRLISSSTPTVPLQGDDQNLAILVLNQLLQSYASTGLMLTIAKTVNVPVAIGQKYVYCGPADFVPTPDITVGRMANVIAAWIELDGVDYPLISQSRDEFLASFKYEPLQGLPRFLIVYEDTLVTQLQIYPAPSQVFEFFLRAKFQLNAVTSNDDLSILPQYYIRYLLFAGAKDVAMYKGRSEAWTPKLEQMLQDATDQMVAASEVNTEITGDRASLLNGSWRVISGI